MDSISGNNLAIAIIVPVVAVILFLVGWYFVYSKSKGFRPGQKPLVYYNQSYGTGLNTPEFV